jgi:flavin reductase (DIM6/NTAB) family NADH-FMN oxidoreductase RutF
LLGRHEAVTERPSAADAFESIVGSLDGAMVVVTTAVDSERAGCLVGFHAQSSIEPKRLAVWLSKANHTYRVALRAKHFAVHFLATDQFAIAQHFGTKTGDDGDKFVAWPSSSGPGGVPILSDVAHWMALRRVALLDEGGDHVCLVGEVTAAWSARQFTPLRLSQVAHLQPGHDVEERHSPPTERAASEPSR